MTVAAVALLSAASWTLGRTAFRSFSWPELRRHERFGLEMTAGLGLAALLLSLLALAGWFAAATPLLLALAVAGPVSAGLGRSVASRPQARDPEPRWVRAATMTIGVCAIVACAGAVTPVADYDALSYVMPIAERIAASGRLRVWPEMARSMWPLDHEVLLAYVLRFGGDRLIAVVAVEWLAALLAVAALARRACARPEHVPLAILIALAAPVVAFQISTAKEDLLLVAAVAGVGFALTGSDDRELAVAGLFAGIAAGTKYPGAGVAVAAVAWAALAYRGRRLRAAVTVAGVAFLAGGLWYVLNLVRFGNPVAPFVFGARGTPLDVRSVRDLFDSWGLEHRPIDFVLTPVRIFVNPDPYLGRAAMFNPLAYAGLAGLAIASIRRRSAPLFLIAAVLYVGWFFSLENARLLLPAAVVLAPAAADVIAPIVSRSKPLAWALGATLAIPLGLIPLVGVVRAYRYAGDPAHFIGMNTEYYADIQWMNAHLDPRVHRIASVPPDVGYLRIPYVPLAPTYQMVMTFDEVNDPAKLLAACRRLGITHVFAGPNAFPGVPASEYRIVRGNSAALRGGEHFFQPPRTEPMTLYEVNR
jgi:hypothetical protein